jgi:SAM-dependent methyltransferase
MAISWTSLGAIEGADVLKPGARVIDFGSSNLYHATAAQIEDFVRRYTTAPPDNLPELAQRLEAGSKLGPDGQALNQAFIGEMFEAAGMTYDAIDIADGYKTTIVDLNFQSLPDHFLKSADVVLNFGTSEHILNQANVFKSIHDACKPGGMIMHQLPAIGFVDHAYYCYTGRFFYDLAAYNEYELVDIWFDGNYTDSEDIYSSTRAYARYFPHVSKRVAAIGVEDREKRVASLRIPTVAINVVLRKVKDKPFGIMVETSTSVGAIPASVTGSYTTG